MSKLREIREERGLRIIDVAIKAQVSSSLVWMMETGQRVSRRKKIQVACALNVPFDELFPPTEDPDGTAPLASGR
jgi:transcriptional regulator with XRE-family HTH domain